MRTGTVEIGDKVYNVQIAETDEEKATGLQGVTELGENEGMLFEFSPEGELTEFWMQDTPLPLDIVFIDLNGVVKAVKQGIPNSEDILSEDGISNVLEVNANSGIQVGDEVFFDDGETEVNEMYVIGTDGKPQMTLVGGERIINRDETKRLVNKAKKAYKSKSDKDYLALGKYMHQILDGQNSRPEEWISGPNNT